MLLNGSRLTRRVGTGKSLHYKTNYKRVRPSICVRQRDLVQLSVGCLAGLGYTQDAFELR